MTPASEEPVPEKEPAPKEEKTAEEPKKEEKAGDTKAPDKPETKAKDKKPAPKDDSDPIHAMAKKIETINDMGVIEELTIDLLQSDKVNEFQLGGYLLRLQNSDDYIKSQAEDWKTYLETVIGIKSRKAFYLVNIYKGLTEAEVSWSQFENIGWTKVVGLRAVNERTP